MKFPVAIDPVCCLGHHRRILVGGSAAKGALGMDCCGHAGQAAKLLCCCAVGMGVKGARVPRVPRAIWPRVASDS